MMTDLQQSISGLLSRSAAQVGTTGGRAVGSRAAGPCSAAMDLKHAMVPQRPSVPRVRAYVVRAYVVRECCGGVSRSETVFVRLAGR